MMGRYANKNLTEECGCISVQMLNENGCFAGDCYVGEMTWTWSAMGFKNESIALIIYSGKEGEEYMQLQYTFENQFAEVQAEFDYKVMFERVPCNLGGYRRWFICPLVKDGEICGRRIGKLYLPPDSFLGYFGCRHCYELTYLSSRESHKYDAFDRKFGVGMLSDYV